MKRMHLVFYCSVGLMVLLAGCNMPSSTPTPSASASSNLGLPPKVAPPMGANVGTAVAQSMAGEVPLQCPIIGASVQYVGCGSTGYAVVTVTDSWIPSPGDPNFYESINPDNGGALCVWSNEPNWPQKVVCQNIPPGGITIGSGSPSGVGFFSSCVVPKADYPSCPTNYKLSYWGNLCTGTPGQPNELPTCPAGETLFSTPGSGSTSHNTLDNFCAPDSYNPNTYPNPPLVWVTVNPPPACAGGLPQKPNGVCPAGQTLVCSKVNGSCGCK